MDLLLPIVLAHWRRRLQGSSIGKLRLGQSKVGASFVSLDEAYEFYNICSWECGFGIRYGESNLDPQGTKCRQPFVCACEVWHLPPCNVLLMIFLLLISTLYQLSEKNIMFYRGNQPSTTIHPSAVNAQYRFVC